jgi:Ni/Fe-hydrogenase subunit HybB-like protein
MKADARHALRSFLFELAIYSVLITVYFLLVLHFLGAWLSHLDKSHIRIYAVVCVALIIGQALLLEAVTTWILRLLRGRSE